MNVRPILNKRPYIYAFCTGFALFPLNTNENKLNQQIESPVIQQIELSNKNFSTDTIFKNYFEGLQKVKK